MRFPRMWHVRRAKPQISLLVAWIFYECSATGWTSFGVSKVKRRLYRIVRVYTCQNGHIVENHMSRLSSIFFLLFLSQCTSGVKIVGVGTLVIVITWYAVHRAVHGMSFVLSPTTLTMESAHAQMVQTHHNMETEQVMKRAAPRDSCTCMYHIMGFDARKPVFGFSDQVIPQSASSVTETI